MRVPYTRGRALHFHCNSSDSNDERTPLVFRLSPTTVEGLHPLHRCVQPLLFFDFDFLLSLSLRPPRFLSPDVDRYCDFLLRRSAYNRAEAIIDRECDRLSLLSFGRLAIVQCNNTNIYACASIYLRIPLLAYFVPYSSSSFRRTIRPTYESYRGSIAVRKGRAISAE